MSLYRPLKALLTLTPSSDIRYYLNGINVQYNPLHDQFYLEASDGHRAARIAIKGSVSYISAPDKETDWSIILPKDAVADVLRGASDKTLITLKIERGRAVIKKGSITTIVDGIDGRYPMIERIVPDANRAITIDHGYGMNAVYLSDIGKFATALRSATYPTCILNFGGPSDAMRIDFSRSEKSDYESIVYVIMPARTSLIEKTKVAA